MRDGLYLAGIVMALAILACKPAHAQIETLVMPGKVIEGHAEYESECSLCHLRFERGKQRTLCLDCHEDVASDIEKPAGFHGRFQEASESACASCHTDHEGRDADIVNLDEEAFDHDFTDFPLLGKHAESECSACHADDEKHREAPADCYACHEEDNPHGETLGTACGDCHLSVEWLDVEFDHDATGYPLVGKHQEPGCLDCHADNTFQGAPTECYDCHAEDDAHDGRSGNECSNCHNPRGWDDTSFDHNRDTDFRLDGKHAEQSCEGCHSDDPFSDELDMACISCHLEDDNHDGHFGESCESCHASSGWPDVHFNHEEKSGYALIGAHGEVECTACHIEPVFDVELERDCLACHEDDDAHEGTQGTQCLDCHSEASWKDDVFFDHDLTRFPLLGKHAETECGECHDSHVFRDAPEDCIGCHRENDSHDGRFGEECALCHNPVDWQQWLFDHDKQTSFPLDGAHADVACQDCHRQSLAAQTRLGQNCADCHRSDDIHDGEFGPDCGRCHSADSFRDVRSIQ